MYLKFPELYLPRIMKEDILEKASELYLLQGFKLVTMDDIAHEMGISKKTIYSHYAHKTELVQDVSMHIMEKIFAGVDKLIQEGKNPIEELYDIKKYVMQHIRGEHSSPVQQLQRYYPKIYADLKLRQFEFMQHCVSDNIHRGLKAGLFRDNLDVAFVSRIYFIGMTGIKDHSIFPDNDFPPVALHEQYLEYHLRGIVTPAGRSILNQLIHSNRD